MAATVTSHSIPHTGSDAADSAHAAVLAPCTDPDAAQAITRRLAHAHYENFSVISFLLPRHLRQDFCNIYAFCRVADDCGDSTSDATVALASLARLKQQTHDCYAGHRDTALLVALAQTIAKYDIPIQPFLDLIDAFEQDQRVRRYDTFDQLLDYCRRSANPVGWLVLYLCGYRDEPRQRLSDQTCTGLQLANFWQDIRRDLLDLDRIYLPRESMRQFGISEDEIIQQVKAGKSDQRARDLVRFEVQRTIPFFDQGEQLLPLLDRSVRSQIELFGRGGRAICRAIEDQNYDTLVRRPSLSNWQKGKLMLAALGCAMRRWFSRSNGTGRGVTPP